ncbi:hypothetical protein COLO4_11269 [Corchorus olitorius]|uniref:DUF4283 domain-containing protein n=1 Tax=Corchorus olitorius TaxID=93759 RepID=A0A1R3K545_9ROSI|nr:hypothetical protein COLO4_11269 [Corchorus olitorius]
MRIAFFNAWKPEMGLVIKEVGGKLYMFKFEDGPEKDRVLVTQPWHFNRALLVLKEYDGVEKPESIVFDTCLFWVRIFDIPLIMMTEKIGAAVGEVIGPVMVDHQWGNFIRICIKVDVIKPLLDGTVVSSPYGDAKAEFPRSKSNHFDGSDGSFYLGGSGSRRHVPMSVPSGPLMNSIRGGHAAQQSSSVGNSRCHVRNHVDSLVLRGKQVERALLSEDSSYKVITCFPGKEVTNGAVEEVVVGRKHDKRQVNAHFRGGLVEAEHSAYSTTNSSFGSRELRGNPRLLRQLAVRSGACSYPSIPGTRQSNGGLDHGELGPDLMGLVGGLVAGSSKNPVQSNMEQRHLSVEKNPPIAYFNIRVVCSLGD